MVPNSTVITVYHNNNDQQCIIGVPHSDVMIVTPNSVILRTLLHHTISLVAEEL